MSHYRTILDNPMYAKALELLNALIHEAFKNGFIEPKIRDFNEWAFQGELL